MSTNMSIVVKPQNFMPKKLNDFTVFKEYTINKTWLIETLIKKNYDKIRKYKNVMWNAEILGNLVFSHMDRNGYPLILYAVLNNSWVCAQYSSKLANSIWRLCSIKQLLWFFRTIQFHPISLFQDKLRRL